MNNNQQSGRVLVHAAAALILVVPATAWAVDWFLKLDGIKGESRDILHRDELQIDSFSWAVRGGTKGTKDGSGMARAPTAPCMNTLVLTRPADAATPPLLTSAALGSMIPKATLSGVKQTGAEKAQDFFKVELTNVFVSSISHSGSGDALYEALELRFAGAKVSYSPQDAKTGNLGKALESNLMLATCN